MQKVAKEYMATLKSPQVSRSDVLCWASLTHSITPCPCAGQGPPPSGGRPACPPLQTALPQLETLQQLFIARDGRLLSTLAQKMAAAGQWTLLLCSAVQGRHTAEQVTNHPCRH